MSSAASRRSDPPVIDYEGSPYRTEFWEGQGRDYEDATDRLAIKRLMPSGGRRIAEIGAGFGRLSDICLGYQQIILFDYSRTLLQDAVARWGHDDRFIFVAGNIYRMALAADSIDTLLMIRVMHHLANVPRALAEIYRVMHPEGVGVLEYANKRNIKAIGRWLIGRQSWSPLDTEPIEFVELNYNFHPAWMWEQMTAAQLAVQRQLAVSHFRIPLFKRAIPAKALARADSWLYRAGGLYPVAPSVYVQVRPTKVHARQPVVTKPASARSGSPPEDDIAALFSCPTCRGERTLGHQDTDLLVCSECDTRYARTGQIWDFKEPV